MRMIRWVGLLAIVLLSGCGFYRYRPAVYSTYNAPAVRYYQAPPVYAQPTYVAPTYVQPTYVQPTYVQPTYVQPTYVAPQPTYVAPSAGAYGQVVTPLGGVRGSVIVNP